MKITTEVYTLDDFNFWSGAEDTINDLTYDEVTEIIEILDETYPNGMTDVDLNNFFWFERDTIAEWLGYADYDELLHRDEKDE